MNNDIMSKLAAIIPANTGMELPPKIFIDMDGEFIDFVEGKTLTVRFPNKERYRNPFSSAMNSSLFIILPFPK